MSNIDFKAMLSTLNTKLAVAEAAVDVKIENATKKCRVDGNDATYKLIRNTF